MSEAPPDRRPGEAPAPRRVQVTSPRTERARTGPRGASAPAWSIARDLDEQTELGAVYARTLIRAQLRAALLTGAVVLLVLAALPLLLTGEPGLGRQRLCGVPLPWLLLALAVQPVWIAAAAGHVRRAERIEDDFARLVDRS
ncbi:hypothetical protein [Actinomadura macrotermitis]|uniref:DUF485 domain-containing protein n=1 Tax=Actinomadura macrotermitis TaxID=2585200 RepID=A0A7K0BNK6_9ACTN|nr:hypothetical protein [Actinomadura macrotermitis]MQY02452.1 hypothetical protein [Actinomadura macrotermitis]